MITPARCAAASLLCLVLCACSQPGAPEVNRGVENLDLALRLATVPEGLTVATNQGSSLELRPTDEMLGGVIWFAVGPETPGVNLVAEVKDHQTHIEGMPDGDYRGAQELQGDFGTAFYSRGRFSGDKGTQEETRILLIHPAGNRLLTVTYRYPAGEDSAARVEQLIDVLSYVE